MNLVLHLAWLLMTLLRFAGVAVLFAGVALFGIYFIGGNARASNGKVPPSSWMGTGPKKGIRIVLLGLFMLLLAYVMAIFMPNGR
jgi:hypothetical protein